MEKSQIELLMELAADFQQQTAINNRASEQTEQSNALSTLVDLARDMQNRLDQQQNRIRQLELMVESDELTGLYNRRGFMRRTREALARAARTGERGLMVIADLDGFKEINDEHGHAAGDAVLRHFGQNLRTHTRSDDYVARFGGDEFAILMTGSSPDAAQKRITQLQQATARFPLIWQGKALPIKASFGHTVYDAKSDISELIRIADDAMYEQKHASRKSHNIRKKDTDAA
ncbi:GGDEF domain-containing protein [Thalassospira sp. SM2505]|uniref:diguanylate cyclase n=1 Tax=Thalassospira profundimaris TaxID=502049 RepID=A0A367X0Y7_9PROT|nr:GGDEF domain-containing protein [Thalassospira profundimaris]RCK46670.1 diguanylate cyclase [Thalassospira profundimaris]